MTQFLKIAHLDEDGVERVRALEADLNRHIMAFEPGLTIANLSDEQLAQIRQLEEDLGVTLLVYED
jgi:hypothetical protein